VTNICRYHLLHRRRSNTEHFRKRAAGADAVHLQRPEIIGAHWGRYPFYNGTAKRIIRKLDDGAVDQSV